LSLGMPGEPGLRRLSPGHVASERAPASEPGALRSTLTCARNFVSKPPRRSEDGNRDDTVNRPKDPATHPSRLLESCGDAARRGPAAPALSPSRGSGQREGGNVTCSSPIRLPSVARGGSRHRAPCPSAYVLPE